MSHRAALTLISASLNALGAVLFVCGAAAPYTSASGVGLLAVPAGSSPFAPGLTAGGALLLIGFFLGLASVAGEAASELCYSVTIVCVRAGAARLSALALARRPTRAHPLHPRSHSLIHPKLPTILALAAFVAGFIGTCTAGATLQLLTSTLPPGVAVGPGPGAACSIAGCVLSFVGALGSSFALTLPDGAIAGASGRLNSGVISPLASRAHDAVFAAAAGAELPRALAHQFA